MNPAWAAQQTLLQKDWILERNSTIVSVEKKALLTEGRYVNAAATMKKTLAAMLKITTRAAI